MSACIALALCYVLGAIPVGLILAFLWLDLDVREGGSGNIGATNTARLGGRRLGALVLLLDALKGVIPVALVGGLSGSPALAGAAGCAAVVGHCWPAPLAFRGGKGVATAAGAIFTLSPAAGAVALTLWAVGFFVSRRASVGSLLAAFTLPIYALFYAPPLLIWVGLMGMIIGLRHRDNLNRLRQGEEPPLG